MRTDVSAGQLANDEIEELKQMLSDATAPKTDEKVPDGEAKQKRKRGI